MKGTFYDHGDMVNMKQCLQCQCHDGSMQCTKIDPNTICPPLPCPPEDQFSVQGECCKFCPGTMPKSNLFDTKLRVFINALFPLMNNNLNCAVSLLFLTLPQAWTIARRETIAMLMPHAETCSPNTLVFAIWVFKETEPNVMV